MIGVSITATDFKYDIGIGSRLQDFAGEPMITRKTSSMETGVKSVKISVSLHT